MKIVRLVKYVALDGELPAKLVSDACNEINSLFEKVECSIIVINKKSIIFTFASNYKKRIEISIPEVQKFLNEQLRKQGLPTRVVVSFD